MKIIRLARLALARARECLADMDYQWARANAPDLAAHKLRALYRAKRARILAAARRLPAIDADAVVLAVTLLAAPPAIVIRILEVSA